MIQIIKCPCGKTFAACLAPECYADANWQKEMRGYIKKGCIVGLVENGSVSLQKCECRNMKPVKRVPDLSNQLA